MNDQPAARRARRAESDQAAGLPFRYVGGDPSLDLVNTVDWTVAGPTRERLADYPALLRWAEGGGILARRDAARLRELARQRPRAAQRARRRALELRALLHGVFGALAAGERAGGVGWRELNAELAAVLPRRRLALGARARGRRVADWTWEGLGEELDSPLWPVVLAAAQLLTSEAVDRLRLCGGADCGWLYLDRSRNGLRRWCEMETCGTAAKTRRRRERRSG